MNDICSLTALDGRYARLVSELKDIFSEYGLMKHRLYVEMEWFKFVIERIVKDENCDFQKIDVILKEFNPEEALKIKDIEKTTNHDVKAVEYYIKGKLTDLGYESLKEWVHFSCTSADINNTSYALMLKEGKAVVLTYAQELLLKLESLGKDYKSVAMMSRTHGQPATPTTVGKEFINFAWKIRQEIRNLENISVQAKFSGATGNFNAHYFVFPDLDWIDLSQTFLSDILRVEPIFHSTQINPNNYISEMMHSMVRMASIIIDIDRDMWGYISLGYFSQKLKEGEIGSSTMPHKVNPIDFENSEGNLGLTISLGEHLATKLLNSRFQRDLTDSTVSRTLGSVFGYMLIGIKSILKGLDKVRLNEEIIRGDLENNYELLAEAFQTAMRVYAEENPYEKLKELTRGKKVTKEMLEEFVDKLTNIPEELKIRMKKLRPDTYVGLSAELVDKYFKSK